MTASSLRLTGSHVLPADLENALAEIGDRLARGELVVGELDRALDLMAGLPAAHVAQADSAIASAAKLHLRPLPTRTALLIPVRASKSDTEQLLRTVNLEKLFIFHRDGRLREAALLKLSGKLSTPFLFAAVAWRLNDWAPPVRAAAVRCASRCFPVTDAEVIAGAAAALLVRQSTWARWGQERVVLDEAFNRADVAERLSNLIVREPTGSMATTLRFALRTAAIDIHLERITRDAMQPSVRAVALNTLINRRAEWPRGYDWQWRDKSMGLRRRVTTFGHRELSVAQSRSALIALGIHDRSAVVRRVALDGVCAPLAPGAGGTGFRGAAGCGSLPVCAGTRRVHSSPKVTFETLQVVSWPNSAPDVVTAAMSREMSNVTHLVRVDRQRQRAAHARVVERLARGVEAELVDPGAVEAQQLDADGAGELARLPAASELHKICP